MNPTMGDTTTTTSTNPVTTISAGYEQLKKIFTDVIGLAEQTPWYVWAAIAALLLLKNRGDE